MMERSLVMTTLTIYTEKYDLNENVANNGLSGKAFLDMDDKTGMPFLGIDQAMDYICSNDLKIHQLEFCYKSQNGSQMFKRYKIVD